MQAAVSNLQCSVCGEAFGTTIALQQHIDQTRHMNTIVAADYLDEYRMKDDDKLFYCKRCHKSFTAVAAVLQHHEAKHSAPKKNFYRMCGNCNTEQTSAFGWLNHRGDCKKVPLETRNKIKLIGLKCIANPATCSLRCAGIGMILHLKDEHKIDLGYFEDDFAEKFQKEGLVEILADEEARSLPQFEGLQQQFDLSAYSNSERLKRLHEAKLRVIHSEGDDLAGRRAREFKEYMEWLEIEQSQMEHVRRMKILREKEDACARAIEAEKLLTEERRRNSAAVFAEVRVAFEKTSAYIRSNQTAAAKQEMAQIVLKLQRQTENDDELARKESAKFKSQTKSDVLQLQEQLTRLRELKKSVSQIVERVAAVRAAQAIQGTRIAPEVLESLSKYSDAQVNSFRLKPIYDDYMSNEDIMDLEKKHYKSTRKPEMIWVPSFEWVKSCVVFTANEEYDGIDGGRIMYRLLLECFDECMNLNTPKYGVASNRAMPKVDSDGDIFSTRYIFEFTFDDCYFFVKNVLSLDKSAVARSFMTEPVFFFQAVCRRACNSERFGDDVVKELGRLMLLQHPDLAGSSSAATESAAVPDGAESSGTDVKSVGKKNDGPHQNNQFKYVCCIPMHLRYMLQDSLPKFSQSLFAKEHSDTRPQDEEFEFITKLGENYTIFFGSVFYLRIMEARNHLKCDRPKIEEYLRACLNISFTVDIASEAGQVCLKVPWQDVMLSVRASQFLRSDCQPSLRDWQSMLGNAVQGIDPDHIARVFATDVSIYAEKWRILDSSFETPAKGFFDFELNLKSAFQSVASHFLADGVFEQWWSIILNFRRQSTEYLRLRDELCSLAPKDSPPTVTEFWDNSDKALWFLDFIRCSSHILYNEFDKPREFKAGSKRPLPSVHHPKTLRDLFDFVSKSLFGYDCPGVAQLLMIQGGTPQVKVFRNFSEWIELHKSST